MADKQQQLQAVMPKVLNAFQRTRVSHVEPDEIPVHTKQEFAKECDINEIMRKAQQGVNPPAWMTNKTPYYGDFTQLPQSLTEATEMVRQAEEAFMGLPVEMRRELDHDYRNLETAPASIWERYGLLQRKEETEELAPSTPRAAESTRGSASRKAASAAQGSRRSADPSRAEPEPSQHD